jgi:hypothetical protein
MLRREPNRIYQRSPSQCKTALGALGVNKPKEARRKAPPFPSTVKGFLRGRGREIEGEIATERESTIDRGRERKREGEREREQ